MTTENQNVQKSTTSRFTSPLRDRLHGKKTNAKRIGVKSVLSYGDKSLAITGFGRGNEAEIVFTAPNGGKNENTPLNTSDFTIQYINDEIGFAGGLSREELEAMLHNPTERVGEDLLKLKSVLEKEFFGREFPNSNIHIQLIHNILDIQKILGLYINDVLFTINNLQASEFTMNKIELDPDTGEVLSEPENLYDRLNSTDDVLGVGKDKQKAILPKLRPYLGFFGDVFKVDKPNTGRGNSQKKNDSQKNDNHNLNVLRTLSALRHWTAHWKKNEYPFFDATIDCSQYLNATYGDWNIVANNYKEKIDRINRGFLSNSGMNIKILSDILGLTNDNEKKKLAQDYYEFSIVKLGKNLGLSVTKLRERIIDKFFPRLRSTVCDAHRSKIYTISDYLIYRYLKQSPKLVTQTVASLQKTANTEQKDEMYSRLAQSVWTKLKDTLEPFFKKSCNSHPVYICQKKDIPRYPSNWIDDVKLTSEGGIPFVMLMSFLGNFLEGKEINELLTSYINKFENIQSFIDTLSELNEPIEFVKRYSAFNLMDNRFAQQVAKQLRVLASIGKMNPDLSSAKKPLYRAAIEILGADDEYVSDEWLEEHVLLAKDDMEHYKAMKGSVNPFRNFIANNVIESRRFHYLVRYSKPKTVRALMNNAKVVRYTLSRLPEKQIDTYYKRTGLAHPNAKPDDKLDTLARFLTGLTFETVWSHKDGIVHNPRRKPVEVEQLKAQINLYLTVAYIAIKQLVKINARYYIAFQILERDSEFMEQKVGEEITCHEIHFLNKGQDTICNSFALTKYFLEREKTLDYKVKPGETFDRDACNAHVKKIKKDRHFTQKWRNIFENEIAESLGVSSTGFLPVLVRNMTEHLHVLSLIRDYVGSFRKNVPGQMESYFELYHYLMQSACHQVPELQLEMFKNDVVNNGIPDDRLIHVTYVPFAYNLARYKNLTTEALFDEDSVKGQQFVERTCYKEAWNRIATAKRRGKSDDVVKALIKEFVDIFGDEQQAQQAVREGELRSLEDEAREKGKNGIEIIDTILPKMKQYTPEEVARVQSAYDSAVRNTRK